MSESVYFLTIGLFLGTILAIFAMKYLAAVQQARAQLARDQAYRDLATKAVADQADTAAAILAIEAAMADVGPRLARIERVLQEVE